MRRTLGSIRKKANERQELYSPKKERQAQKAELVMFHKELSGRALRRR